MTVVPIGPSAFFALKVYTKLLVQHIETVIPKIIAPDQTAFTPGRQSFYNICRQFNLVYSVHSDLHAETGLSVQRKSLIILNGSAFSLVWIDLVLAHRSFPRSSCFMHLKRNQFNSVLFILITSVLAILNKLGYGLLSIKPLADEKIAGITRGDSCHKVFLYADELLLCIDDPISVLPQLRDLSITLASFLNINVIFPSITGQPISSESSIQQLSSYTRIKLIYRSRCLSHTHTLTS